MSKTIYMIRCTKTGRVYVGATKTPVRERYKKHLYRLRRHIHSGKIMQEDFDKYGERAFGIWPIFPEVDDGTALRLERIVMELFRAGDPRYGYNRQDHFFDHIKAEKKFAGRRLPLDLDPEQEGRWTKTIWFPGLPDSEAEVSFTLPARDLAALEKTELWRTLLCFIGLCQRENSQMAPEKKMLLERLTKN